MKFASYYDWDGNPITLQEWAEKLGDAELERDEVGPWTIKTVWLGIDYNFGLGTGPPLIFETEVFGSATIDLEIHWRYAHEDAARNGHLEAVYRCRDAFKTLCRLDPYVGRIAGLEFEHRG